MRKGRINAYLWLLAILLTGYIFFKNGQRLWEDRKYSQSEENSMISGFFAKNYLSDLSLTQTAQTCFEYEGMEEGIIDGESEEVKEVIEDVSDEKKETDENNSKLKNNSKNIEKINKLIKELDYDYLKTNFYTVDSSTSVTPSILDAKKLTSNNVTIKKNSDKPQILIYHTHSTEKYADSEEGNIDDTVVGVGEYLTTLLTNEGYNVYHDTSTYDVVDGKWNRNAYETALSGLNKIMKENPSIEVTIDLHRNAGKSKVSTVIDGKETAQIMFFNGVSRTRTGSRSYLENKNQEMNLSFSLQLLMQSMRMYDDFAKKIYIKGYRYNLHIAPRAMLIEVGNDKNTVEEAKNAMVPFAKVLTSVLEEKQ